MISVSDKDVYENCDPDWLWIFDKLIVARKQGILAAPAGIPVPRSTEYVVRPITNIRMMGRGARKLFIHQGDDEIVPDGFFWSEVLVGLHISVDYHWGEQTLTVQGHRDDSARLDRFSRWSKVDLEIPFPKMLYGLEDRQEWINVEYIGSRMIEVHLRPNDDFANHDADEIWPVWPESDRIQPVGCEWYASPAGDRLGFWIKGKLTDAL